ncbi:glycosyltransferase [Winogradskyella sp. R77965]|uniref:glycosyltransferase n=1 Tax=Winogradskyella sp. R77965 TaxID=3093872 RepID=UPI0037DD569A
MEEKISVIIPVYKVEEYLNRCIDSIINQTYKNLEIILVNDGSPDKSGEICDSYTSIDDRVIVIHKENEGSSCARNAGLDVATGDYISYVDSDDYLEVNMLETVMKYMLKNNLEVLEIEPKFSTGNKIFDNKFAIEDTVTATNRIIANVNFAVWRRVFKKSLVEDMRFIPKIIHQDVFYTMDMLKRTSRHGYLNTALYNYNSDNESIIRSKYSLEKIKISQRATEYIINNSVDHPSVKKTVANYVTYSFTDHYFLLSRNTNFDPDKFYRKKLKKGISKSLSFNNANFRSLLVILLPSKILEYISSGYQSIKSS